MKFLGNQIEIMFQNVQHYKKLKEFCISNDISHVLTINRESDNTSLEKFLKNRTRRYPNAIETIELQLADVPRNPKRLRIQVPRI